MKKTWQFVLAGIAVAVGGALVSALAESFLNGLDAGAAAVLGMGMYLCVVVVTCTGVIVSKLDRNARANQDQ